MASKYAGLNRASISYDYLHTNSTTHEFLFGAIVELVDNARDALAKEMQIDCPPHADFTGGHMLTFLDDGSGMDRREAIGVMTFGYSAKRLDPNMIGQYGNGLKSGAMRIGKDFILFTKRSEVLTCVFLSRSFHEEERLQEVIVPVPSFTLDKKPLVENDDDLKKHKEEMEIILRHSPYKTESAFFEQFDRIEGQSGTLVICFNLRLLENGEPELDLRSDPTDIKLANPIDKDREVPEKDSLRTYLAVVYSNPHMKVYVRGKKVATRRILSGLYKPRQYKYLAKNFKARAAKELERSKQDVIAAKEKVQLSKSEMASFQQRHVSTYGTNLVLRAQFRQLQNSVETAEKQLADAEKRCKEAEKSKNDPKPLTFIFGLHLERRGHCGCMIFNNGRLIKMYEQVGPQKDGGIKCLGVIGVVDVPYVVLEPTHNKQSFADSKEYQALLRALGEHMEQYWRDINLAATAGGVPKFWEQYGYRSNDWSQAPLDDDDHRLRRNMSVKMSVQCNLCLKWRILDYQKKYLRNPIGDDWNCSMHPNATFQNCSKPEVTERITEGKLYKVDNDDDEAREKRVAALAKQKEKAEKGLQELQSQTVVRSTRDARRISQQKQLPRSPPVVKPTGKAKKSMVTASASSSSPEPEPEPSPRRSRRKSPSPPRAKTKAELRRLEEENRKKRESAEALKAQKEQNDRLQKQVKERERKAAEEAKNARLEQAAMERSARRAAKRTAPVDSFDESEGDSLPANVSTTSSGSPRPAPAWEPVQTLRSPRLPNANSPPVAQVNSTTPDVPAEKRVRISPLKAAAQSSSGPTTDEENLEKAAAFVRKFLVFFMPPKYKLTKEKVGAMSPEDLLKVDIDDFQHAYETGLREMLDHHRNSAKNANDSLTNIRRNVAQLLNHVDAESVPGEVNFKTDDVDRRLEMYLKQLSKK